MAQWSVAAAAAAAASSNNNIFVRRMVHVNGWLCDATMHTFMSARHLYFI
jgi:hypothetical protein